MISIIPIWDLRDPGGLGASIGSSGFGVFGIPGASESSSRCSESSAPCRAWGGELSLIFFVRAPRHSRDPGSSALNPSLPLRFTV